MYKIQTEMVEPEAICLAIKQTVIQVATAAVIMLKEVDTSVGITANAGEQDRPRYGRIALRQLSFDWKPPDKYVKLLSFEWQ